MKNLFKRMITAILCTAILFTGIGFHETVPADAKTSYTQLKNGSTINMKVGERKRFLVKDADGKDMIPWMKWYTSDRNIVMISSDFVNQYVDLTEYIEFNALSAGTATITGRGYMNDMVNDFNGTNNSFDTDFTVTVKVTELETATAAQKKCKHAWKTTTKSTCKYAGVKTCKKCGFQKRTKKAAHKYVEVVELGHEVLDIYFEVFCEDGCSLDSTVKLSDYLTADEIKKAHYVETNDGNGKVTGHITGVSDGVEKKFFKAADEAMEKHSHVLGNWFFGGSDVLSEDFAYITVMECINCDAKKQ